VKLPFGGNSRDRNEPSKNSGVTMSLFSIIGTVTAIGQSVFNNDLTIFAYVEITEATGRRVSIEKVAVCNDIMACLEIGAVGEFFVDRIFKFSKNFRCQMFGIKSNGVAVLDKRNLRTRTIIAQLIFGLALTPLFGVGLLLVVPSLFKAITFVTHDRHAKFYGADSEYARRLAQQQAIRI
jgi:hypothetical protein